MQIMQQPTSSFKVFIRIRPFSQYQSQYNSQKQYLKHSSTSITLKLKNQQNIFQFDKIYPPQSTQQQIYYDVADDIIQNAFDGINGTMFCYGQTSSGKTYTIIGQMDNNINNNNINNNNNNNNNKDNIKQISNINYLNQGLVPRVLRSVINKKNNKITNIKQSQVDIRIKISMVEIYNEKVRDLLDLYKNDLKLRENKKQGVFIQNVTQKYIVTIQQCMKFVTQGLQNRTVGRTNQNAYSSRSHMLFIITIHQTNFQTRQAKSAKITLIDLAGSQKLSKTGVEGKMLIEAKKINTSLSTLGKVIHALSQRSNHIPYRDSKLTRLLQQSIGGNSLTRLIINLSPSFINQYQTITSLRFGSRAKLIKNKPIVNKQYTIEELLIMLQKAEIKIKKQMKIIEEYQRIITTFNNNINNNNINNNNNNTNNINNNGFNINRMSSYNINNINNIIKHNFSQFNSNFNNLNQFKNKNKNDDEVSLHMINAEQDQDQFNDSDSAESQQVTKSVIQGGCRQSRQSLISDQPLTSINQPLNNMNKQYQNDHQHHKHYHRSNSIQIQKFQQISTQLQQSLSNNKKMTNPHPKSNNKPTKTLQKQMKSCQSMKTILIKNDQEQEQQIENIVINQFDGYGVNNLSNNIVNYKINKSDSNSNNINFSNSNNNDNNINFSNSKNNENLSIKEKLNQMRLKVIQQMQGKNKLNSSNSSNLSNMNIVHTLNNLNSYNNSTISSPLKLKKSTSLCQNLMKFQNINNNNKSSESTASNFQKNNNMQSKSLQKIQISSKQHLIQQQQNQESIIICNKNNENKQLKQNNKNNENKQINENKQNNKIKNILGKQQNQEEYNTNIIISIEEQNQFNVLSQEENQQYVKNDNTTKNIIINNNNIINNISNNNDDKDKDKDTVVNQLKLKLRKQIQQKLRQQFQQKYSKQLQEIKQQLQELKHSKQPYSQCQPQLNSDQSYHEHLNNLQSQISSLNSQLSSTKNSLQTLQCCHQQSNRVIESLRQQINQLYFYRQSIKHKNTQILQLKQKYKAKKNQINKQINKLKNVWILDNVNIVNNINSNNVVLK